MLALRNRVTYWIGFSLLLAALAPTAWAQVYAGSLSGAVQDPSNAVIPGATVKLINAQNGFTFTGTTNADGLYAIHALPPGTYTATASANGFATQTQPGIVITVSQSASLNFHLTVGSSNQTVTITAAAPLLNTENAQTGQQISNVQINNLPLVNRDVMDLTGLTPGIVNSGGSNNFYSNGGRNSTSDVLMDGVSTTNYEQNSGVQVMSYTPSVDSVEEFSVQQTNFSAEFGNTGGTVVNMITKSGTNNFHGSVYEFLRNQHMDANNFFNNASSTPISPLKRNEFGGTFGGPIQHNKTFFFVDYDGTRNTGMSSGNIFGVPSPAERTGNFGEVCTRAGGTFNSNGRCVDPTSGNALPDGAGQLWDPFTGVYGSVDGNAGPVRDGGTSTDPYPAGNFIPYNDLSKYTSPGNSNLPAGTGPAPGVAGNLINPVALKELLGYPLPNLNVGTAAYDPFNNFTASGPTHSRNDQFDIKVDRHFANDLLSVKYSESINSAVGFNCFGNEFDTCSSGPSNGKGFLFSINETHTLSPDMILTFTYGFNRASGFSGGMAAAYPGLDPSKLIGEPSYMDNNDPLALPSISYNNYSGGIGTQGWSYLTQGNDAHQVTAALSWMDGAHDLKFGFDGRMRRINFYNPGPTGGEFGFSPSGTNGHPGDSAGDDLASFMISSADWGDYEISNHVSSQSFSYGAYAQDNWKLTSAFTLNLGLRWDVDLPRTERFDRMNWLDPSAVSPISDQVAGYFGHPLYGTEVYVTPSHRNDWVADWNDFQPRLGFSWQVLPNTVLRGGYGMYYSTCKCGAAGPGAQGWQGWDQWTTVNTTYNSDGTTPWGFMSNPFPATNGPIPPPGNTLGAMNDIGHEARGPLPSWNTVPYIQSWSFGLERQLPWAIVLDANYVGSKGTHLYYGGAGSRNYLNLDSLLTQSSTDRTAAVDALTSHVANPFFNVITDPNSSLSSATVQAYQLQVPYPQYTNFGEDGPPWGVSSYNALQAKLQKHMSNGLDLLVSYTFSKTMDDASANDYNIDWLGIVTENNVQDPNCLRCEYSVSGYDDPQILQVSYVYQLPIGTGHLLGSNWGGTANALLGGWQTSGTWRFDSGFPIRMGLTGSKNNPLPTYGSQRPLMLARPERNHGADFLNNYFANADQAFGFPDPNTLGNTPRYLPWVRKPGMANVDMAVFKSFQLGESRALEFRAEALNAFNHVQFSGPNTSFGGGSFGEIHSQANSPREVQLGLTFHF